MSIIRNIVWYILDMNHNTFTLMLDILQSLQWKWAFLVFIDAGQHSQYTCKWWNPLGVNLVMLMSVQAARCKYAMNPSFAHRRQFSCSVWYGSPAGQVGSPLSVQDWFSCQESAAGQVPPPGTIQRQKCPIYLFDRIKDPSIGTKENGAVGGIDFMIWKRVCDTWQPLLPQISGAMDHMPVHWVMKVVWGTHSGALEEVFARCWVSSDTIRTRGYRSICAGCCDQPSNAIFHHFYNQRTTNHWSYVSGIIGERELVDLTRYYECDMGVARY